MILNLSADQSLLRETTAAFLDKHAEVDAIRARRRDQGGFDAEQWRRGAELGWTSLVVSERRGGGAVGEHGLVDLSLVAHEFGRHAAPGPLVPTNVVLALLDRRGAPSVEPLIADLMAGAATAAWCLGEPPPSHRPGSWSLEIREEGDQLVIDGIKRPVEAAATADALLVTGRTGNGLTNVVIPASTDGVTVRPLISPDLTRRYATVEFSGVRVPRSAALGEPGTADDDVWWCFDTASCLAAAESVGAMERILEMTVEWAFDRYSFGRPLASYQALKHRFADMKMWLEASHAITDAAVVALAEGRPEAGEKCAAAAAYVGHHGAELGHDCIQMHGGIGVTFEHDLHVFLRRITVNRTAHGGPADHRARLAGILEERESAAAKGAPQ